MTRSTGRTALPRRMMASSSAKVVLPAAEWPSMPAGRRAWGPGLAACLVMMLGAGDSGPVHSRAPVTGAGRPHDPTRVPDGDAV